MQAVTQTSGTNPPHRHAALASSVCIGSAPYPSAKELFVSHPDTQGNLNLSKALISQRKPPRIDNNVH